ncbi:tol-pal system protein YbgF [Geobacter sp. DSM 9736]|uniref:tol-pal system protein YbgF n=1 Tax=Geobacter sp. DSM 9736 TaxID=1277350 RepID=UPI000B5141FD|nr:tol-pal system protein YbgF [Geobacter sp. DSM 9736]SNB47196.1 tol-pal system protein YbgF [Geobacter sp. DSM 9736]
MTAKSRCLVALVVCALAGCASQTDMANLQRDMDEMKARLLQVDRDVAGVKSSAREDLDKSLRAYQKDIETLRRSAADIQATIESTKVDNQVLSGKLDDVALLAKKPADDIALLREDMERRLKVVSDRMVKLEAGLEEFNKKIEESKPREPQQTPEGLYQKALDSFRAGDLVKSREMFGNFMQSYPSHDLVPNAQYWLGETLYAEKKYDQAILEFQQIIKKYPNKEKVPAAMLKQAMAFKELGDVKSARYVLKKLQEDYPFSEEAQKAKDRLKELK